LYTEAQHTWLLKLHIHQFVGEYKKRQENVVANGLSRIEESEANVLLMVTAVESDWVEQVKAMVQTDDYFQSLNTKWEAGTLDPSVYQKKNGLFYYKSKILINPTAPLTGLLIVEHHDKPVRGHTGYEKTLQRLKK